MSTTPIADYALLSDRHSAALVSRGGSVDWLCFPRFDSPSILGRLLGEEAGHWSIGTTSAAEVTRRYLDRTMVLETTLRTPTGAVTIADALAMGLGDRGHDLGKGAPHVLVRRVTCIEGRVDMSLEFVPRPEYGLVRPLFEAVDGGVTAFGGGDVLVLSSSVDLFVDQDRSMVSGQFQLGQGESAGFAVHHRKRAEGGSPSVWSPSEIGARFEATVSAWESWSELHQAYVGPWRDLVHHSGRVLQSLSFAPTGAICAAATTSLPEVVGGDRNWDYRCTWVRDASFTIKPPWVAACPGKPMDALTMEASTAARFARWGRRTQIVFEEHPAVNETSASGSYRSYQAGGIRRWVRAEASSASLLDRAPTSERYRRTARGCPPSLRPPLRRRGAAGGTTVGP